MQRIGRARAIQSVFAFWMLLAMGGGCVAIYSFDDFEKTPPVTCKVATECPGSDTCGQRQCENGICRQTNLVASGTLTAANRRGDCQRFVCDGKGNEITEIDATDIPYDANDCTLDVCNDGVPSNPLAAVGTNCGSISTVVCNSVGGCEGCTADSDCGMPTACLSWTCINSICVKTQKPVGTVIDNPKIGDCKKNVCDLVGSPVEAIVPDDAPTDDNPCTADVCTADGEVTHTPSGEGIQCDDCAACTKDGICAPCDSAAFDCYEKRCVPKPQPCTPDTNCPSGYCVDGFCCDQECTATCMACSNEKTGAPSGVCAPITDGMDPESECNAPAADTCSQGQCRCANGVRDGDEIGVDCGGTCNTCTGKWNCGGISTCQGLGITTSCCDVAQCLDCGDNSGSCNSLDGQTCALGAPPQVITLGTVFKWACSTLTACQTVKCTCE